MDTATQLFKVNRSLKAAAQIGIVAHLKEKRADKIISLTTEN